LKQTHPKSAFLVPIKGKFKFHRTAHFFHNIISFGVFYLTVRGKGASRVDWDWLDDQTVVRDGKYLRHVAVENPLEIRVDGLAGLGLIKVGDTK